MKIISVQWMKVVDHDMKLIFHLMIGHFYWVEDASVKGKIAEAKQKAQEVLKPGQVPGGSKEDNEGEWYSCIY